MRHVIQVSAFYVDDQENLCWDAPDMLDSYKLLYKDRGVMHYEVSEEELILIKLKATFPMDTWPLDIYISHIEPLNGITR